MLILSPQNVNLITSNSGDKGLRGGRCFWSSCSSFYILKAAFPVLIFQQTVKLSEGQSWPEPPRVTHDVPLAEARC